MAVSFNFAEEPLAASPTDTRPPPPPGTATQNVDCGFRSSMPFRQIVLHDQVLPMLCLLRGGSRWLQLASMSGLWHCAVKAWTPGRRGAMVAYATFKPTASRCGVDDAGCTAKTAWLGASRMNSWRLDSGVTSK